jgi:hypothetical protein
MNGDLNAEELLAGAVSDPLSNIDSMSLSDKIRLFIGSASMVLICAVLIWAVLIWVLNIGSGLSNSCPLRVFSLRMSRGQASWREELCWRLRVTKGIRVKSKAKLPYRH